MPFAQAFHGRAFAVTIAEHEDVLGRARALASQGTWLVVLLKGTEALDACLELYEATPRALLLLPAGAAVLTRMLTQLRLPIAADDEEPLIVLARLVAMSHAASLGAPSGEISPAPARERGHLD